MWASGLVLEFKNRISIITGAFVLQKVQILLRPFGGL
jgi:hypothetical protein